MFSAPLRIIFTPALRLGLKINFSRAQNILMLMNMKSLVLLDFLAKRLKASSKSSLNGPFFQRKKSTCFKIRREFSRKELTLKLAHNSRLSMLFLTQYPIF